MEDIDHCPPPSIRALNLSQPVRFSSSNSEYPPKIQKRMESASSSLNQSLSAAVYASDFRVPHHAYSGPQYLN